MREFVIMTDSCCDLPYNMVKELGLQVQPLSFLMDDKEYFNYPDNRDISPKEFYDKLREGKLGTTSAVSVGSFAEAMTALALQGKDILCLAFSSALSTTYQSACIAANDVMKACPGCRIEVLDTLAASMGQGMLVWLAARKKEQGATLDETMAYVQQMRSRLCTWVTVNDLHHLKRGGRVSATAAVVGTMLQMKPIIELSDEGKLEVRSKVRGRAVSMQTLLDKMEEYHFDPATEVFISHGDCLDEAQKLADMIRKKYKVKVHYINHVGPVIGNHTGPGVLALFFLAKA